MNIPDTRVGATAKRKASGVLTAILTMMAVLTGLVTLGSATSAQAAEVPGAVHDVQVTNQDGSTGTPDDPIESWETVTVTAQWSVPDSADAGDTFGLTLPDELQGLSKSFVLRNDAGAAVARCVVTERDVTCTLTSFASTHTDVHGSLYFNATFTEAAQHGETNHLEFGTGGQTVDVPVVVGEGVGYHGNVYSKFGSEKEDGSIGWFIYLRAGADGLEQDLTNVVVQENLGPNQTLVSMRADEATELNAAGTWPLYTAMDSSQYSVDLAAGTVVIPKAQAGHWYRVYVVSQPTPGSDGPYTNAATIDADEIKPRPVSDTAEMYDAGGDGDGQTPQEPQPQPQKVTMRFQVDRYHWGTRKLGRAVARLARDGHLTYREDKALWGHSRWEFVKIRVRRDATWRQIVRKVNARTTLGNVTTAKRRLPVRRHGKVTMAWRLAKGATRQDPWGPGHGKAQAYLGRGRLH